MIKMVKILTYGSLRKGEYNNSRFNMPEPLRTFKLDGHELFSLGSYPAIIEGEGSVVVEEYDVPEDLFRVLNNMELGSGYEAKKFKGSVYWVYKNKDIRTNCKQVVHGDWVKRND